VAARRPAPRAGDRRADRGRHAHATRARARTIGAAEEISRRCLHLLNLPAGTDVRRVREQLARMERRIAALSDEIADLEHGRDAAAG